MVIDSRFSLPHSRLGVSEVVMVDNDVVSASNLNRQVLYSGGDIGRRKVDAAVEGLDRDNLRTCEGCSLFPW